VAILTGTLAAATFLLALFTWRMSMVSSSEIAVTVRPLVVDAPLGVFMREQNVGSYGFGTLQAQGPGRMIVDAAATKARTVEGAIVLDFAIRNAGSGPALLDADHLSCDVEVDGEAPVPALALSHTVLPLGEPARVEVRWTVIELENPDASERKAAEKLCLELWARVQKITVSIPYTDMTGRQPARSVLTLVLGEEDDNQWRLARVDVYRRRRLRKDALLATLSRAGRAA